MTVFLLIREDQNQHGYIDMSILGLFRDESAAREQEVRERQSARSEGLIAEDDDSSDADWQVALKVEEYVVR